MKKIICVMFISLLFIFSVFPEFNGNIPSIDFTFSPEGFIGTGFQDDKTIWGTGINGVIQANFKIVNKPYENIFSKQPFSMNNVFGLYLKNSYSAIAFTSKKYLEMGIGGGLHLAGKELPLGLELGMMYNPISKLFCIDSFLGYLGEKVTFGVRSNYYIEKPTFAIIDVVFGWNFRFDIRNSYYNEVFDSKIQKKRNEWIIRNTYTKDVFVKDIEYFVERIKNCFTSYDDSILNIPIRIECFEEKNGNEVIQNISFVKHSLSNGILGTSEYIAWQGENVKLQFTTEYEKIIAFDSIVAENQCRLQQAKRIAENDEIERNEHEAIYKKVIASKNLKTIADYINKNYESKFFHDEAYVELAKVLSNDNSVELKELPYIKNPYGLDKNCLYYCNYLSVFQWTGNGSLLAEFDTNKVIFIRNVYDLTKIDGAVRNGYLKYIGTHEYSSVSAGIQVVAEFDLVYSLDAPFYEK